MDLQRDGIVLPYPDQPDQEAFHSWIHVSDEQVAAAAKDPALGHIEDAVLAQMGTWQRHSVRGLVAYVSSVSILTAHEQQTDAAYVLKMNRVRRAGE